jgi:hypothetical protein
MAKIVNFGHKPFLPRWVHLTTATIWSAPAERSGDGALAPRARLATKLRTELARFFPARKNSPKNITLITNNLRLFDKIHLSRRSPFRQPYVNVTDPLNHLLTATYRQHTPRYTLYIG